MVGLPKIAVAVVFFNVDHVVVCTCRQAQAKLFNTLADHRGPANQRRPRHTFVHHDLAGAQHAFFFAFGVDHTFFGGFFSGRKNRLHRCARRVDKALQTVAVRVHVGNRTQCYSAVCSSLGHSRRNLHHQARVKRLGDQILGAKRQRLARIGGGYHLALLGLR